LLSPEERDSALAGLWSSGRDEVKKRMVSAVSFEPLKTQSCRTDLNREGWRILDKKAERTLVKLSLIFSSTRRRKNHRKARGSSEKGLPE
jgi:hypothetical protein